MTTTASRPIRSDRPVRSTQRHQVIGLTAAFGIGTLVAVQSRVNGELGARLGDGVAAALISFVSGLVILLAVWAMVPQIRRSVGQVWQTVRRPSDGQGSLRWWQCIGGLAGAYLVATQSITVAVIGVAVFTVAVVAGQAVSSLVVDRLGFGPAGPQPYTPLRVFGALLALVAVVLAVSDRLNHPSGLLLAVLPALAGVGTAVQQAINGRVAHTASPDAYGAVAAGLINFLVGTTALLLVFVVDLIVRGAPHSLPTEPWLYVGGACGVIFISAAAAVVRVVGVFVLGLGTIAGQLIASLFIDLFLPASDQAVTLPVVAGTLLALVAVVIASIPNLRR
ncbi:transporter family-2 protein [Kribbella orskensis]|uniref:Transporter family-2 protein n=1 Tax=Kribbella orskensis TaxID=2512216 RepID=A0ABY2BNT4_9ACTN|nr:MULTISPECIES: DMT family transporter [Kribbella]TCN41999.1 transporter family-2 protein [Kribbella sp. VKM Ac-2500]TCO25877.1 transporter family-2 protein [Kribbella orskensis]